MHCQLTTKQKRGFAKEVFGYKSPNRLIRFFKSIWIDKRFGFYITESMVFNGRYVRIGFITFALHRN